jgi:diguanylate cyclase (GGDEF)-like protein/PAS domain S-box-containing protein
VSDEKKPTTSALRAAAEARLGRMTIPATVPARPGSRAPTAEHLGHELQVHQIELEMQNEALRKSQVALEESRDRYVDLYEFAPVGYLTLSPEGLIDQINLTGVTLLGRERSKLLNRPLTSLVAAPDQDRWTRHLMALRLKSGSGSIELQLLRPDGSGFAAQLDCVMPLELRLRVALSDISARKLAEEKLRIAGSVFTHACEGVVITDPAANIIDVNDAFCRITGYPRAEVLGQNPRLLSSGRQDPAFYREMWRSLTEKGHWHGEMWNRRKNGELYVEWLNISTVRDTAGRTLQYVGLISDITALKAHQHQLEHIAHYDALTSLPKRVLLADRLRQGMASAQRRGQLLAVVYLDLDGFKAINDTFGHEVGDQLLMALAERMRSALREGDTLARLGGDEFVAVLGDLADTTDSVPILTRLLAATAQPITLGDTPLQVSASLGVTFYPQEEATDADLLLRQADQAMYQAKQAGKNRYHVFDAVQDRSLRGHH